MPGNKEFLPTCEAIKNHSLKIHNNYRPLTCGGISVLGIFAVYAAGKMFCQLSHGRSALSDVQICVL